MRSYLAVFLTAALIAGVAAPLTARISFVVGAVDRSTDDRIPRSGGWAIVTGLILALVLVGIIFDPTGLTLLGARSQLAPIALGAIAILALGTVDDIVTLRPLTKFVIEIAVALGLYALGLRISIVSFPTGPLPLGHLVGAIVTVVWIVGITNAFNLIDGVDGVATGSAFFATLAVFIFSVSLASPAVALVAAALGGALLGFLPYNFPPARMYLGDSGSLFTGYVLAALSLTSSIKAPTIVALAIPIVAFAVPVFDTFNTMIRRLVRGQSLFARDRDHVHHRLLDRGFNARQVVSIIYAVSATFALGSMLFLNPSARSWGVMLVMAGAGVTLAGRFLRLHELNELARALRRGIQQPLILARNAQLRSAVEHLNTVDTFDGLLDVIAELFGSREFDEVLMVVRPRDDSIPPKFWKLEDRRFMPRTIERRADEWSIDFPFEGGATGEWIGELQLLRRFGRPTLLVDLNLVLELLRPALLGAAKRIPLEAVP